MLLLDMFGAFTKLQDWEEGRQPIVWASNAYLMEQTGFSLSALKRHARRLVEAGLIAFKDSPNGKRWGHRGEDGYIIEAYGYDLAPLAARAEEFEQLFGHLQAERQLCLRAKRQITIKRRTIRAKIEIAVMRALQGPWNELYTAFEALLERLPRRNETSDRLFDILDWFSALLELVEKGRVASITGQARGTLTRENGQPTDSNLAQPSSVILLRARTPICASVF